MKKRIITSVAPMFNQSDYNSDLETELLYGDLVDVIKSKNSWCYCKNISDNYKGWIECKHIGQYQKNSHCIINKNTIVYQKPNINSPYIFHAYLNSKICVKEIKTDWTEIILNINNMTNGFIPTKHIKPINETSKKDWLNYAKDFLGTPYLLGGKTIQGIDCSGLVQLALETNNIKFPRNTFDQISFLSQNIYDIASIEKKSLIFWEGHVAIALNKNKVLHSNAFHMKVSIEPLERVINRSLLMKKKILKIKKINF